MSVNTMSTVTTFVLQTAHGSPIAVYSTAEEAIDVAKICQGCTVIPVPFDLSVDQVQEYFDIVKKTEFTNFLTAPSESSSEQLMKNLLLQR